MPIHVVRNPTTVAAVPTFVAPTAAAPTAVVPTAETIATANEGTVISAKVNDAAPTKTDFDGLGVGATLSGVDDTYNNLLVVFTSGVLEMVGKSVIDYVGATKNFLFTGGTFPVNPADQDKFVIIAEIS